MNQGKLDLVGKKKKHTEGPSEKGLNDSDNHDRVVTHLESDILKCEVKWTLGHITTSKASGGDEIYSLVTLISQFRTSPLFHVKF